MRAAKPYLWTLGILWGVPALGVTIGYLLLDKDVPPGACEGIGFGCQLSDADGLLFLAFYFGVPVLGPLGFLALFVVAFVQWRRNSRDLRHGSP